MSWQVAESVIDQNTAVEHSKKKFIKETWEVIPIEDVPLKIKILWN